MLWALLAVFQLQVANPATADRIPLLKNDGGLQLAGLAYGIATMRGLFRRANEEVG